MSNGRDLKNFYDPSKRISQIRASLESAVSKLKNADNAFKIGYVT
jgi:hypothetical protein